MDSPFLDTDTGKETMVEALDILTHNAENLRCAVEEVLYSAERAIIKVPPSDVERLGLLRKLDQGIVYYSIIVVVTLKSGKDCDNNF